MLFLGLVSPDQALCDAIAEQLKRAGLWQLAVFSSMEEALGVWDDALPPVLFWDLDGQPPATDSLQKLAQKMAASEEPPHVIVLGEGADLPLDVSDSFERPLRLGALLARLHFYEKVIQQTPDQAVPLGPWLFNARRRTLVAASGGDETRLTDKETALLSALMASANGIAREKLLQDVWGYNSQADTHTIETHIYRLRRKLMTQDQDDCFVVEDGCYALNPAWRKK